MKIYKITFSPTGGTDKVSDTILSAFAGEQERISILPENADYSAYEFAQEDICLIAAPSFSGRVPETAAKRIAAMKGNSARAVLVCVYGNRAYEDTLLELKNIAKSAGFIPVAAIAAVAEHSIMRQFATGRPDADDMQELKQFGEKVWEKLTAEEEEEITVPGNEEYRKYSTIPMHPAGGRKCTSCGICVKECPVGAIKRMHPKKTDGDKCISCMRCVAVCPQKARSVNALVLAAASKKMAKAFEVRKKNELFI